MREGGLHERTSSRKASTNFSQFGFHDREYDAFSALERKNMAFGLCMYE